MLEHVIRVSCQRHQLSSCSAVGSTSAMLPEERNERFICMGYRSLLSCPTPRVEAANHHEDLALRQ
jgi:hypothetical protein